MGEGGGAHGGMRGGNKNKTKVWSLVMGGFGGERHAHEIIDVGSTCL